MIRLKNIEKKDNIITADAFVEDCNISVPFVCNTENWKLEECVLPVGYEDCGGPLVMAKHCLKRLLENNEELPKERLVMWY